MSKPTGSLQLLQRPMTLAATAGAGLLLVATLIALAPQPSRGEPSHSGAPSTIALGEVTGIASPCVGLTTLAGFEALPVRVTLVQHSRVVTAETVTGDHRFLLAAPPGRYVLTSDQYQRPMRFSVVLRGLQTVQVNLHVSCKWMQPDSIGLDVRDLTSMDGDRVPALLQKRLAVPGGPAVEKR